jgi:DNA-binding transcriptional LysR family regulator
VQIEIRHARVISVLAEAGSISKAAAELGLPQPSLSAQLRRIEKAVGGDLFVRSAAGVAPTLLGERLLPMLADLVARADAVITEAAMTSPGRLRIGAAQWSPVSLHQVLRSALTDMDVLTETVDPVASVDAVCRGALTAALVPVPEIASLVEHIPAVEHELIVREPIWVALPKEHRFAGHQELASRQWESLAWVRYTKGHWFRPVEDHLFYQAGDDVPEVLHHVGGQAEAMNWVRDAGAAALATPSGPVLDTALVPLAGAPSNRLMLVWRRGAIPDATLQELIEALREHYCELARGFPRYWLWMVKRAAEFPELSRFLPRSNLG